MTSIGPAPLIPLSQATNQQNMKYLFGPVNSRRLGLSLGIDIMPPKVCNFNCIYCEVGATTRLTCERREYVDTAAVLAELEDYIRHKEVGRPPDVYTVTGSGEPTYPTCARSYGIRLPPGHAGSATNLREGF